jgi:selenocysteine lyase/cysteine desulfurase
MAGTTAAVDYFAWIGRTMAQEIRNPDERLDSRGRQVRAGLDFLFEYEKGLAMHLIDGLQQLPGVTIQGITDAAAMERRVPTVAFTVDGKDPDAIAAALGRENIFVWSGHNYAVETARHLGIYDSGGAVRIGPVHYNSMGEIDHLLSALDEIL